MQIRSLFDLDRKSSAIEILALLDVLREQKCRR